MMAAALGAEVYPGRNGAEIGWFPLTFNSQANPPAWFAPLLARDLQLFHWHGDSFDLPPGATLLASSDRYENQAFAAGNFALGLQFHPEVTAEGLEAWYVGHACELHQKGISVAELRASAQRNSAALQIASTEFARLWLDHIL
jgi:GMP synthase (glutamine-hydrolysing)